MDKFASALSAAITKAANVKLAEMSPEEMNMLINARKGSLPGSVGDWLLPTDETKLVDEIYSPGVSGLTGGLTGGALGALFGAGAGPLGFLAGGAGGAGLGALIGLLNRRSENAELASVLRETGNPNTTRYDMENSDVIKNRRMRDAVMMSGMGGAGTAGANRL